MKIPQERKYKMCLHHSGAGKKSRAHVILAIFKKHVFNELYKEWDAMWYRIRIRESPGKRNVIFDGGG